MRWRARVIVEWPERAATGCPQDRLDIAMDETATPNRRRIVLTGHGSWEPRLERLEALSRFLSGTHYAEAPAAICKAMPRRALMRGSCCRTAPPS